jgi:DNA-directed RNA polymerase subunit RPC12/RpoP
MTVAAKHFLVADIEVVCARCRTSFDVPGETKRAVRPRCEAVGRWFTCLKCGEIVDVWAKKDRRKWQYICPHCRHQQWVRTS